MTEGNQGAEQMILTDEEIENCANNARCYYHKGGAVELLAKEVESAVINKLATVEGGPVAFVKFKDGEVDWDTDDQILISNTSGDCMYPNIEWREVYTAEQVAAARAQDAAEIERLKADTNLQTYKEAIKSVRGLQAEIERLKADVARFNFATSHQDWAVCQWQEDRKRWKPINNYVGIDAAIAKDVQ